MTSAVQTHTHDIGKCWRQRQTAPGSPRLRLPLHPPTESSLISAGNPIAPIRVCVCARECVGVAVLW